MAPPASREQEQSIKARKLELFQEEQSDGGPPRPFSAYLAETEAAPVPAAQKAALWGIGIVVLLLLLAAILTVPGPRSSPHPQPAAKAAAPGAAK